MSIPPPDWTVDVALAHALLEAGAPGLRGLPLRLHDVGWDNVTFRLGDDLAVRIPRRAIAVELLENELRWLPTLASEMPFAVPEPVVVGTPSATFPHPWAVVRWVPGRTADEAALAPREAPRLAAALRRLHRPAPANAPGNDYRGVPLEHRRGDVEVGWPETFSAALRERWHQALKTSTSTARVWLHGDLHPRNLVIDERGQVAGIIDWGDLCAGDAATDLAVGYMAFDPAGREAFFAAYGADDAARDRAAGWAILFATLLIGCGEPRHVAIGERIGEQLEAPA